MGDNSKLNLTSTKDIGYLPVNQECMISISSPTTKDGTVNGKQLSDIPQTTPMLSLLLNRQTSNRYSCHDKISSFMLIENELIKIEKHKLFNERESTMNYQYNLLVTKSSSTLEDVEKVNEKRPASNDDEGLYCPLEDSVSKYLNVSNCKTETFNPKMKQWEILIDGSWNKDFYRHRENQVPAEIVPQTLTVQDHHTNRSTTALIDRKDVSQPAPSTTLTFLSTDWVELPHQSDPKEDSHWYVIVDRFRMKEKLTRRQLFQIAAMMALGFVFVALIVVWVFSPILF